MVPEQAIEFPPLTEAELVRGWRQDVLVDAGYPRVTAMVLASAPDVDLHRAADLVRHGCPPLTAAQILL